MSSVVYALLITLCNVWCLISGASVAVPDVAVRCAEEALLPCKVLWDSSITYQTASWYKMAGEGEGIAWKVLDVESHYPKKLGGSLELSNDTFFSLRIKNATSRNSGTYKCILGQQSGEHNLSGTVTLRVTGCPGIEDEKLKKYKAELFMLTCLGIFYLLLIFFTCSRAAMQRRGDLVPSALSNCKYLVTFSTNASAPREWQLIFAISVCEDNASTLCYSYIVKDAARVARRNLPGFTVAGDENYSIPRRERSVTISTPCGHRRGKRPPHYTCIAPLALGPPRAPAIAPYPVATSVLISPSSQYNLERQRDNFSQEQKN